MILDALSQVFVLLATLASFLGPIDPSLAPKGNETVGTTNIITSPKKGDIARAGSSLNITWTNLTGVYVDIYLDAPNDPHSTVNSNSAPIAFYQPNTGFFEWDIESILMSESRDDYRIRILYDSEPEHWSYSERFTLNATRPYTASLPSWWYDYTQTPTVWEASWTGGYIIFGDPPTVIYPDTTFVLTSGWTSPMTTTTEGRGVNSVTPVAGRTTMAVAATVTEAASARTTHREVRGGATAAAVTNFSLVLEPGRGVLYGVMFGCIIMVARPALGLYYEI
ncbi:hypothetical protein TWF694_006057 [Orbilia ellipsospora]|uniref:Yeast cell wall synthesis Kre9/Knh1-like N-terminal domain-containing protein n=1 Tax=Orbilia ellipsospora TaxID=2528407 RepID=A0AAV9WR26_9PEZI